MTAKKETAIAQVSNALEAYPIFADDQRQDAMEAIAENLGGAIKISDLTKVTVPLGGGLAFNVQTPEGPSSAQALRGIILLAQPGKAYFPQSMEEAPNAPPACYSNDGLIGIGDNCGNGQTGKHDCTVCAKNQFGTSTRGSGKGKACKDTRPIHLLEENCVLPTIVQTPPTSMKPLSRHMALLTKAGQPYWGVVVEIGLAQEQTPPPVHSVLTFKVVGDVPKAMRPAVKEFKAMFQQFAAAAPPPQAVDTEQPDGPVTDNVEEMDYNPFAEDNEEQAREARD